MDTGGKILLAYAVFVVVLMSFSLINSCGVPLEEWRPVEDTEGVSICSRRGRISGVEFDLTRCRRVERWEAVP